MGRTELISCKERFTTAARVANPTTSQPSARMESSVGVPTSSPRADGSKSSRPVAYAVGPNHSTAIARANQIVQAINAKGATK